MIDKPHATRERERVVLEGLRPLGAHEAPTPAEVRAALAAREEQRAGEAAARRAHADALANVSTKDVSELADARRALAQRVAHHGDELAERLLAFLDEASQLEPSQAREAALAELSGAARSLCFRETPSDREQRPHPHDFGATPRRPTGRLLDGELTALLELLDALLREVIFEADVQEHIDASRNAAAYLRAATRLQRAAVWLRPHPG